MKIEIKKLLAKAVKFEADTKSVKKTNGIKKKIEPEKTIYLMPKGR